METCFTQYTGSKTATPESAPADSSASSGAKSVGKS